MLLRDKLTSFVDELEKIAAKVPVVHGTSGLWDVLKPGVGRTILKSDPNARAVYVGLDNRRILPSIKGFAEKAVQERGGTPSVAHMKIDTKKGWMPKSLSDWGRQNIGSLEDAHDLVRELDAGVVEPRRGEIWELLQRGTGAWRNSNLAATAKPSYYTQPGATKALPKVVIPSQ